LLDAAAGQVGICPHQDRHRFGPDLGETADVTAAASRDPRPMRTSDRLTPFATLILLALAALLLAIGS
jgi:hypothetical protein